MAEAELTKDVNRIKGVTWCGSRQGSCYTGTLPFGTGALCYQYEGTRLVATVDALEMAKLKHPHVTELMENEEAGIAEFIKLLEECWGGDVRFFGSQHQLAVTILPSNVKVHNPLQLYRLESFSLNGVLSFMSGSGVHCLCHRMYLLIFVIWTTPTPISLRSLVHFA